MKRNCFDLFISESFSFFQKIIFIDFFFFFLLFFFHFKWNAIQVALHSTHRRNISFEMPGKRNGTTGCLSRSQNTKILISSRKSRKGRKFKNFILKKSNEELKTFSSNKLTYKLNYITIDRLIKDWICNNLSTIWNKSPSSWFICKLTVDC